MANVLTATAVQPGYQPRLEMRNSAVAVSPGDLSSLGSVMRQVASNVGRSAYHDPLRMQQQRTEEELCCRKAWSPLEDECLKRLVELHGSKKWCLIASYLPGRKSKQCRERWNNHLRHDIKKDAWTPEEEKMLIEAQKKHGNRWAEIARYIEGRSENAVKNHFNATLRRQARAAGCRRRADNLLNRCSPRSSQVSSPQAQSTPQTGSENQGSGTTTSGGSLETKLSADDISTVSSTAPPKMDRALHDNCANAVYVLAARNQNSPTGELAQTKPESVPDKLFSPGALPASQMLQAKDAVPQEVIQALVAAQGLQVSLPSAAQEVGVGTDPRILELAALTTKFPILRALLNMGSILQESNANGCKVDPQRILHSQASVAMSDRDQVLPPNMLPSNSLALGLQGSSRLLLASMQIQPCSSAFTVVPSSRQMLHAPVLGVSNLPLN